MNFDIVLHLVVNLTVVTHLYDQKYHSIILTQTTNLIVFTNFMFTAIFGVQQNF